MLIYILDPDTFDRVAVIEEYESCIWTERYTDPGDVTLIVPEVAANTKFLRPGIVLENEESRDPMLLEMVDLKDGVFTCTGRTIEAFFNQRSIGPKDDYGDGGEASSPDKFGAPGEVLAAFVHNMQQPIWADVDFPGLIDWYTLDQADGDSIYVKINKREKVHDLLLRLAKQYNIDMYIRRLANEEFPGEYYFAFGTRNPVDRTSDNEDGNATVRFSPEDDSLIDVHEIYSAEEDVEAVVVRVPQHFTAYSDDGHTLGYSLNSVIYGHIHGNGTDFVDELSDLNLPMFDVRILEVDSEKITLDYLKDVALIIDYGNIDPPTWAELSIEDRQQILINAMKRLAKAEYKKTKRNKQHVIDGEVSSTIFRFGIEYKLGDKVEITSGLRPNLPYTVKEMVVSEYIRSLDQSGYRSYPTLSPPYVPSLYEDDTGNEDAAKPDYPTSDTHDHSFSVSGLIPDSLTTLAPHKISVKSGQIKQIISVSQSGPSAGECTIKFLLNGIEFTEWDLPINLANHDTITIDVSDNNGSAVNVSGHFAIRVRRPAPNPNEVFGQHKD